MMRRILLKIAVIAGASLTAVAAQAASARYVAPQDRAEARISVFSGNLPGCEDPAVIGQIASSFNAREAKFWGPLQIVVQDHVRPLADRPWGDDFIPRRFCTGRVALNDGSLHRVDYSVRESLGFMGYTWNVNWCVTGLDRHRSYAPDCKMARP